MIKKTFVQMGFCLKLFLKDRTTFLVFCISVFLFLFCMADLNRGAEEMAAIPIGLIDGDKTEKSEELAERLKNLESFLVKTGNYEELVTFLQGGEIRCILEIKEGYQNAVSAGKYRELIAVYHEEGDNVATLVTDIAAGEMMYDICQAHAYFAYEKLPEEEKEKFSREEYEAYAASLIGGEDFDFAFDFRFVEQGGDERREGLKNSLFYRQIVAAMAAMLFSLFAMSAMAGVYQQKESGIARRAFLLGMGRVSEAVGNLLACTLLSMVLAAIFAVCVGAGMGEWKKIFPIFWTSAGFSVMMALIYYFLAKAAGGLFVYQMAGTLILAVLGICGFCSIVEGVLLPDFPKWFHFLPNCAYLRNIVKILK